MKNQNFNTVPLHYKTFTFPTWRDISIQHHTVNVERADFHGTQSTSTNVVYYKKMASHKWNTPFSCLQRCSIWLHSTWWGVQATPCSDQRPQVKSLVHKGITERGGPRVAPTADNPNPDSWEPSKGSCTADHSRNSWAWSSSKNKSEMGKEEKFFSWFNTHAANGSLVKSEECCSGAMSGEITAEIATIWHCMEESCNGRSATVGDLLRLIPPLSPG